MVNTLSFFNHSRTYKLADQPIKLPHLLTSTPYLEYFQQFEKYLEAFKTSINAFENDPILQEFRELTMTATNERTGEACKHYPVCYTQSILYKLRIEQ